MGNASASVQTLTSFGYQLNLSLLYSATKQQSPGPLFVLLHPSPASIPDLSSSLVSRVAHGYCTNKALAGVSVWAAWKQHHKALGSNGFC